MTEKAAENSQCHTNPGMSRLRAFLVLGRVSNLPTVWSNCFAGWWLGGHRQAHQLPLIFATGTFLYLGGMFLNDAFDVEFDQKYRRERPVPSGSIALTTVCIWGCAWLVAGVACALLLGLQSAILALTLALCIVLY